ncbi:hypothetical protein DCAR_0519287 [Daucus carota subsp. sativus]|uniref:Uncharacterized protein n=1 Tax=Daucus carota subsp. sativus TaxID=79200 RepID=A0A164XV27_DAUCS|nr:hypothetical protein DCAR_0519287 [Daucus carota subsp. sativus]
MKMSIHIKYINSALRAKVFERNLILPLQELIAQKFLTDTDFFRGGEGNGGASSSGDGGGASSSGHGVRRHPRG